MSPKFPYCPKFLKIVKKMSNVVKNYPNFDKMVQMLQKGKKKSQAWFKTVQNGPKTSNMVRLVQNCKRKCFNMDQMVQNGPKFSKYSAMVKKRTKVVQHGPI